MDYEFMITISLFIMNAKYITFARLIREVISSTMDYDTICYISAT